MGRRAALIAALALGACALPPPHPGSFSFAVFGDMPYFPYEGPALDRFIDAMNAERLAFVVNIGDFKSGTDPCTDALYADRRARFDRSRHPLAYTPGDNDWVDCRRERAGRQDPLERLAKLREVFFAEPRFLGPAGAPRQEVMRGCVVAAGTTCRCPGLPENRRWTQAIAGGSEVVFATLNVQGSNDDVGFDAASDAAATCRRQANLDWLASTFGSARDAAAVVLFFHANPFVESPQRVYDPLNTAIVSQALAFGRPVLVVHGDTHTYRVDQPFRGADGRIVANVTRLETFGSPLPGWVLVTADAADPRFFRFETR